MDTCTATADTTTESHLQNGCAPRSHCRVLARPSLYVLSTISGRAAGLLALWAARDVFETAFPVF